MTILKEIRLELLQEMAEIQKVLSGMKDYERNSGYEEGVELGLQKALDIIDAWIKLEEGK